VEKFFDFYFSYAVQKLMQKEAKGGIPPLEQNGKGFL
jgi:hypothetical protein